MRRYGTCLPAALLLLTVAASRVGAQPEPAATNFQNDSAHTGDIVSPSLRLPLQAIWSRPAFDDPSHPIIVNRKIYMLQGPIIICYDLSAPDSFGWLSSVSDGSGKRAFTYDSGTIYFKTRMGPLRAFDALTGVQKWTHNWGTEEAQGRVIVAQNGIVYLATGYLSSQTIRAIRGSDGVGLWTKPLAQDERSAQSCMAVTDEGVYVNCTGREVMKFHPVTGALLWHHVSGSAGRPGIPVVHNGIVYVRAEGVPSKRLNAATGALIAGDFPSTVAPAFGSGRGFHHDGTTLWARNPVTNANLWQATYAAPFAMPPISINGNPFTFHEGGTVNAWNGATGANIWTDTVTWRNPPPSMGFTSEYGFTTPLRGCTAGDGLLVVVYDDEIVVYASTVYTLSNPTAEVWPGDPVSTDWLVPGGRPNLDWVGLFPRTGTNQDWIEYRYTNGATSGTASFKAPTTPGDYEFRYLLDNGYTSTTASSSFTVKPVTVTLNASPSTATGGVTRLQIDFTAPAGRPATDWIGLYKVGEGNSSYRWFAYTNGAQSGSFSTIAPMESGEYEFRYLLNNGYHSVAASNRVTINAIDPSQFTLSANPSSVARGGPLSVSFTAPSGRSVYDWIGLFKVGDSNHNYGWWKYTNGADSGTFNLTAPLEPGQYEFRYLLEDGYTHIKVSNTVTVQ